MPELGDFGVVRTGGWAGQLIRWGTESPVNHAFVYVGMGEIVEMEPGGIQLSYASKYPDAIWSTGKIPLTATQRETIAHFERARARKGVKYSFLGLAVIALAQRRFGSIVTSRDFLARAVSDDGQEFCSQEVDFAYASNGVQLFDDGRLPGLVSPGDLYNLIKDH